MESSDADFRTTSWVQLRELAAAEPERRRDAMERLTRRYWPPVYAHLRGRGYDRERAAGLAQDFFVDVVIERDLFGKADAERGRLRSYLLSALHHYLFWHLIGRQLPIEKICSELEAYCSEPKLRPLCQQAQRTGNYTKICNYVCESVSWSLCQSLCEKRAHTCSCGQAQHSDKPYYRGYHRDK